MHSKDINVLRELYEYVLQGLYKLTPRFVMLQELKYILNNLQSTFILIPWRHIFIIFLSYKLTSKQWKAVNWQFLFVYLFMCIHTYTKLFRNQNWNPTSSLYWYICDDDCMKCTPTLVLCVLCWELVWINFG